MTLPYRAIRLWRTGGIRALSISVSRRLRPLAVHVGHLLRIPLTDLNSHEHVDNSRVTLYADDPLQYPHYPHRRSLVHVAGRERMRVSLVAVALNEAESAARWTERILSQTRAPDDVVVVDTGSTDGTLVILNEFAQRSAIAFLVISKPGASIAQARNAAIARTHCPLIAVTDFGCMPRTDWLERITAPFEVEPETQVAGGIYQPVDRRGRPLWRTGWLWSSTTRTDPQTFLPPGASIAFAKRAWESVGGYPEWLTTAGEDTWFDLELKHRGGEWAFVPGAVVDWTAPETCKSALAKRFRWAKGDGESGARAAHYWKVTARVLGVLVAIVGSVLAALTIFALQVQPTDVWLAALAFGWALVLAVLAKAKGLPLLLLPYFGMVEAVQVAGFIAGARGQENVIRRRLTTTPGVFFVLSGVPIDDTGGGSRCAQIALELLERGFAVVCVNKYPRFEIGKAKGGISHPHLVTFAASDPRWRNLAAVGARGFETSLLACLIEFPVDDYASFAAVLRQHGGVIVYDSMDAWDTSLGGQWYSAELEKDIAASSDVRIATVNSLAKRLERMTGRPVELVPNAVNTTLFDPARVYARPPDLPSARWTAIYAGALWGEWLDWDLLVEIGSRNPRAAVVVIGDYRGQCAGAPSNVHFLGLKPQRDLPAYLAYADICIIPWKICTITQATSPLKVYEYLAMRRPVVAPDIEPLRGMPGVLLAASPPEFLARLAEARGMEFPETQVAAFIAQNNWAARVEALLTQVRNASPHG